MFRDSLNVSLYRDGDDIHLHIEELRLSQQNQLAQPFGIAELYLDLLKEITLFSAEELSALLQIESLPIFPHFRFGQLDYGKLPTAFYSSYNCHVYSNIRLKLPSQISLALDCLQALDKLIDGLGRFIGGDASAPLIVLNAKSLLPDFDLALQDEMKRVGAADFLPKTNTFLELVKLLQQPNPTEMQWSELKKDPSFEAEKAMIGFLHNQLNVAIFIQTTEADYLKSGTRLSKETALAKIFAACKPLLLPKAYQPLREALELLAPSPAKTPPNISVCLRFFERSHLLYNVDARALVNPDYGITEKYRVLRQLHLALSGDHGHDTYDAFLRKVNYFARQYLLNKCFGKKAPDGGCYAEDYMEVCLLMQATIFIRDDGKIGIDWTNTDAYKKYYAPNCPQNPLFETEIAALFKWLDLEMEPGSLHDEIVLTRESSKQAMLMGLHIGPTLQLPALARPSAARLFSTNDAVSMIANSQPSRMIV